MYAPVTAGLLDCWTAGLVDSCGVSEGSSRGFPTEHCILACSSHDDQHSDQHYN